MATKVKLFIAASDPQLLVSQAERIGNNLGMARSVQVSNIFRIIEPALRILKRGGDKIQLILTKPRLSLLISKANSRERPALETLHRAVVDSIGLIEEAQGDQLFERVDRFEEFLKAVICYHRYAMVGGARQIEEDNPRARSLSDRFDQLQEDLIKLRQFVASAAEKAKVFLSHSHVDKPFVDRLNHDLEKRGITTWYDDKDLDIGDIISDTVSHGIEESWCFLIVVSPASVKSKWVKNELDEAYDEHITRGKKILPVLVGDLSPEEIPRRLKKHRWSDFRDGSKYPQAFEQLHRAIIRDSSRHSDTEERSAGQSSRRETQLTIVSEQSELERVLRQRGFKNVRTIEPAAAAENLGNAGAVILDLGHGVDEQQATEIITKYRLEHVLAFCYGRANLPPGKAVFANSHITLFSRLQELLDFQDAAVRG